MSVNVIHGGYYSANARHIPGEKEGGIFEDLIY